MSSPHPEDARPSDVLVVDAANVVGSRPDGWWRDRAGAAARLYHRLTAAERLGPHIVLVLEGRARAGVAETTGAAVEVVHAGGSGDDAIVGAVEQLAADGLRVVVVTADRGLIARVEAIGAGTRRPGWLLDRLPD